MQDAGRAMRARLGQFATARSGLAARLRLFGLLLLLIVLFAGLRYLVGEGAPRVQVRVVPQDVPVFVPVERIVERVVERPVYVPVPADSTATPVPATPTSTVPPGGTPTPAGANSGGAGMPSASASGPPDAGGAGRPGALPGGVAAIGAGPAGGAPAPSIPVGGVSVPPFVQIVVPEPGPDLVVPADAQPPEAPVSVGLATVARPVPARGRTVIIATEDRLGATVRTESVSRQRDDDDNGNSNDNTRRSARNDGGERSARPAADVAESPAKQNASQPPPKAPRSKPATVQSTESGRPRTSTIPAPIGVKPPPE